MITNIQATICVAPKANGRCTSPGSAAAPATVSRWRCRKSQVRLEALHPHA